MGLLIDNIHYITDVFVNVYIIIRDGKVTLIDTGIDSTWEKVANYLRSIGLTLKDIKTVIITHHHGDHTGSLKRIVEASGARVASHEDEAPLIEAKTGISVDIKLRDGDSIEGLKVIHTPGHTPGHIVLLDPATKSLFVGDLIHEKEGELHEIPHHYSMDPEGNRRSIIKLVSLNFENVMPSHGTPILKKGKEELEKLAKKLGANH